MDNLRFQAFLLKHLRGVGNIGLLKIVNKLDTNDFYRISCEELMMIAQVNKKHRPSFIKSYQEILNNMDQLYESYSNQSFLFILDPEYPKLLVETYNPPIGLFYQGDLSLLKKQTLAIVGAREFSKYGAKVAQKLVSELVTENYVIVSGLAKGIDTIAHQIAITKKGSTIAVIGCGLDRYYPKENQALQKYLGKKHLVLSEYILGTPPLKYHFPMRNRIIAGISQGVCVIEAKKRSGTLITAQLALEAGREVFAVPGDIFMDNSTGCHELIQQGAKAVWQGDHIIEETNHFFEKN